MLTKNTKIVCSIGPASDSTEILIKLIEAGMNITRLNFSHGNHKEYKAIIKNIHQAEKKTEQTIGIMQDLQGPKIRIGDLKEELKIYKDQKIKIVSETPNSKEIFPKFSKNKNSTTTIPIQYENFIKDVKKGHKILINDGLIKLEVIKKEKSSIICLVKNKGKIRSRNGVNLPDTNISIPTITEKDKKDLKMGIKNNVDFIALSFVKCAKDIEDLRKLIKKYTQNQKKNLEKQPLAISKIETPESINNLEEIIKASDGVMIARGDLGVNIPAEKVPIIQKKMIRLANYYGKPIITATEVLQSMVTKPRPTRAEISDAANSVFDHTDAIMLSNETTIGKYPIRAVQTLTKVASTVETELKKDKVLLEHIEQNTFFSSFDATCRNACELAINSNASALVIYTLDGYTANHISKHRLYTPIITITPDKKAIRQLTLTWGINKVFIKKFPHENSSKKIKLIKEFLLKKKILKKNERIIIISNASTKHGQISSIKL